VQILLIADQDAEFSFFERLLGSIEGAHYQLVWCRTQVSALAAVAVADFHLLLWGGVADPHVVRHLLAELKRQQAVTPIILIAETPPPGVDQAALLRGDCDILLRSAVDAPVLEKVIARATRSSSLVDLRPDQKDKETGHADPLTGLSNRQNFRQHLASILAVASKPESVGLLLIDVDQFKKVNASYGQGGGDMLIQLIAERIRGCLGPEQTIARIGGNEFAVVFQNTETTVQPECLVRVEMITQAMSKPFSVMQHAVRMHVSMGIAMNKDNPLSVDALLADADLAMRIAKREKGNNYQFHTQDMKEAAQKLLLLEAEIRRAIRNEEFELFYQPRIDIKSNRIVGAEGLVRWRHRNRGLLPPAEFIALAEESGLIVPLGYWIIHQACRDLNELELKGYDDVQLAVNVSFKQLQDKKFVRTVANILQQQNIIPGRLEFELTETTMMIEGHAVDQSLKRLNELGIDISLDDFGTGYSSFAHIQRLPISVLKIDRSFVGSVTTNEDDATIVKAIISLAHSLNMQVIAEGAETAAQIEFLCNNACDQVQGYFFSKPVTFTALQELLSREDFVERHFRDIDARSHSLQ
jgi:diguanylate cyclase (GGDEF)-like protein